MTKQEEIREIIEGVSNGGLSVDEGLRELDIAGCVIKAADQHDLIYILKNKCDIVAVEPLVDLKARRKANGRYTNSVTNHQG